MGGGSAPSVPLPNKFIFSEKNCKNIYDKIGLKTIGAKNYFGGRADKICKNTFDINFRGGHCKRNISPPPSQFSLLGGRGGVNDHCPPSAPLPN